ncbi:kinase-like protein [Tricholoma matsutake]|nr:kinase-like protein [Tricholoma matsutake 945]
MGDLPPGVFRVCGKYRLCKKIGSGSFGDIYLACNVINGENVAVKMEPLDSDHPKLAQEWKVYKSLTSSPGIPHVFWFGTERGYKAMVMSLLGPSLKDLFTACNRTFTLKTVLKLAHCLISHIKHIHLHHFVHRNIKPNNFLIGIHQDSHKVYIIDFGLANQYRDEFTLTHIPYQVHKHLTRMARYMSINGHLGIEPLRHDDLESLAHILIYFLHGSLPWQCLEGSSRKQRFQRIMQRKQNTTTAELCAGLPDEFRIFLDYTCHLSFDAEPDYQYIRSLFQDLFNAHGYYDDGIFDWEAAGVQLPGVAGVTGMILSSESETLSRAGV